MGGGERGVDVEMEGLPLFLLLCISIIFSVWEEQGSLFYFSDIQSFELAMQDSDPTFYYTKT